MRSANILILLVFLNGAAGVMAASGVGDAIGTQPDVGNTEQLQQANESAQSIGAGSEGVQTTFIGNAISAAKTVASAFSVVYAAPQMFYNLGVPLWLVGFFFGPMYFVVAFDIVSVFAQFRIQS